MKIKGILFDKDGTIIDFYSLWLKSAKEVIPKFIEMNSIEHLYENLDEYILEKIGVKGDKVDPQGVLAYKSYYEIGEYIHDILKQINIIIETEIIYHQIVELFESSTSIEKVDLKPLGDIKNIIKQLKKENIYVGLATADTVISAEQSLEKLDILEDFDFVGGDDGILNPKPESDMFNVFSNKFNLRPEEIAVVGDTYCDVTFAKNSGGIAIGVLSGVSKEEDFKGKADYVIRSIDQLIILLKDIQEEKELLWHK